MLIVAPSLDDITNKPLQGDPTAAPTAAPTVTVTEYLFVAEKRDWFSALEHCERWGGRLASSRSAAASLSGVRFLPPSAGD